MGGKLNASAPEVLWSRGLTELLASLAVGLYVFEPESTGPCSRYIFSVKSQLVLRSTEAFFLGPKAFETQVDEISLLVQKEKS